MWDLIDAVNGLLWRGHRDAGRFERTLPALCLFIVFVIFVVIAVL